MTERLRLRTFALLFVTLFVPIVASAQRSGSSIATETIFEALGVGEGATVCEIGAGDGDLSIAAARLAGPKGRVYTSELGEDRVKSLQRRVESSADRDGLAHITVVAGGADRTNFPDAACDALFMRNVYHHFAEPAEMNASISAALKPGGRLAIVDFSPPGEEATRPADRDNDGMHGVSPESVSRELKEAGLEPVSSETGERRWFMVVAAKSRTSAS
jgi:ubiquinone/menaquinone biosynthesis C-methylase UbiE